MVTSRRRHGVLTTIMALLWSFHGVIMLSYGDLIGDDLRSDCASSVSFALPQRFHVAHTSFSRRHHCAKIVLHIPAIIQTEQLCTCCNCMQANNIQICCRSSSLQTRFTRFCVDGILHFPVPSMNRLNQTEPATFSILSCWAFFRDSVLLYLI
jgi:hypothetical protein